MAMFSFRPISTSLSPNTEWDDIILAIKLLFQPWRWQNNIKYQISNIKYTNQISNISVLENEFRKYLDARFVYSFNSGRSCLMAILYALGIQGGDEVLIQAFTCNAVPNPILWAQAKPVYVDIDGSASSPQVTTLNIDPNDLEKKITHSINSGQAPKAIIVQHTFGQPAQMDKIMEVAWRHNLYVIEDCAHALGAERLMEPMKALGGPSSIEGWRKVGTMGDIAFFSFGRDKVISSVWGGMVATNNPEFAKKIEEFREKLPYPSRFWIFQQILHPILFNFLILPLYNFFGLGKFLLVFLQKINFLSKVVTREEKAGERPPYFPAKMPEALATLALNQFGKLEKFNKHRRKIARLYHESNVTTSDVVTLDSGGVFWRYPILTNNPEEIAKKAKKVGILFDDGWRGSPIVPKGTNLEKMGYQSGSCPKAEKIAQSILSLPTHINITEKRAQKIIDFLKIINLM